MPEEISFVVNTMMLHVSREGFVDYCNNAFIKFVGLPKEQVIGAVFESITRLPGGEIFKGIELPGPKEKKLFSGTNAGRTFEIKAIGGGADITINKKKKQDCKPHSVAHEHLSMRSTRTYGKDTERPV